MHIFRGDANIFLPALTDIMNTPQSHRILAALVALILLPAPAARATWVTAESSEINVETRWVLAESSNISVDTRSYVYLTINAPHGTVTCDGQQVHNATAQLAFTPNSTVELAALPPDPGYLFSKWTGDATGSGNPLSVLLDTNKTINAIFGQDTRDPDHDGLTNYQELNVYHTDPNVADTDGDGFSDGYEVSVGTDPASATGTPETQIAIYTAVEVRFGAGLGKTYRVEASTDLQTWTPVEEHIAGTGGTVTRFYSIQEIPNRYFRSVRE